MYNERLVDMSKDDYIDYLICVLGYKEEEAKSYANILYSDEAEEEA